MGIFAVYDTTGIQNYIFESNKLSENVGGSRLVEDIFNTLLPETIKSEIKQSLPEWRDAKELDLKRKAEIVYEGGGNAFVVFASNEIFQTVTRQFLIRVAQTAPGVGIAVAAVETDFGSSYKTDFEKLSKRLILVKGGFNTPVFAVNQPITKQSGRTGMPVSVYREEEYLSDNQDKKRCRYHQDKKDQDHIKNFDDLAFDKGTDSLIAIIHADGNNMSTRIKSYMEDSAFDHYDKAVPAIRKLSASIEKCFKTAQKWTQDAFDTAYSSYIENLRTQNPAKQYLDTPLRLPLISGGDDITLVISGRFALNYVAYLLRAIEAQPDPFGKGNKPAACAGVVLFHSHYPFSEAYKLAEELCKNAKRLSRIKEGSYLDFHLHQSGNVSGLHTLRDQQYLIDNETILCRPWRVSDGFDDQFPPFRWFEENIKRLKEDKNYSGNKLKAFRNAISVGTHAADMAKHQMRGVTLPDFNLPLDKYRSKYAHYFDILELYDTYENLLDKEVIPHA